MQEIRAHWTCTFSAEPSNFRPVQPPKGTWRSALSSQTPKATSSSIFGREHDVHRTKPLNHAESNLINRAVATLDPHQIATATLYTSCEPCAMCSGAMYWGGINRTVYAMSEHDLLAITGISDHCPTMRGVGCRNILQSGQRHIEVSGPHLVEEACAVQIDYFAARPPESS